MNATIKQTEQKVVIIEEVDMLKQLGIDHKNFKIATATMAYGASGDAFAQGLNALHLTIIEIPECHKRGNR